MTPGNQRLVIIALLIGGCTWLWGWVGESHAQHKQTTYFHPTKSFRQLEANTQKRLRQGRILVASQKRRGRPYLRTQVVVACPHHKIFDAFYDMKQAARLLAGSPQMEKRKRLTPETWLIRTRVKVLLSTITTQLKMTFFRSKRKIESVLAGPHRYARQLYTRWDFEPLEGGNTLVTYSTYTQLKNRTYGWLMRKKHPWTMRKTLRNIRRYCRKK